jgi:hypothetical protein
VRWPDSASKLAHSKRFATSEAPWKSRQRMDCGGLPPLWQMGPGGTGPSINETGGTRSTASLGPAETGPSIESLPSGRGGTRPSFLRDVSPSRV